MFFFCFEKTIPNFLGPYAILPYETDSIAFPVQFPLRLCSRSRSVPPRPCSGRRGYSAPDFVLAREVSQFARRPKQEQALIDPF